MKHAHPLKYYQTELEFGYTTTICERELLPGELYVVCEARKIPQEDWSVSIEATVDGTKIKKTLLIFLPNRKLNIDIVLTDIKTRTFTVYLSIEQHEISEIIAFIEFNISTNHLCICNVYNYPGLRLPICRESDRQGTLFNVTDNVEYLSKLQLDDEWQQGDIEQILPAYQFIPKPRKTEYIIRNVGTATLPALTIIRAQWRKNVKTIKIKHPDHPTRKFRNIGTFLFTFIQTPIDKSIRVSKRLNLPKVKKGQYKAVELILRDDWSEEALYGLWDGGRLHMAEIGTITLEELPKYIDTDGAYLADYKIYDVVKVGRNKFLFRQGCLEKTGNNITFWDLADYETHEILMTSEGGWEKIYNKWYAMGGRLGENGEIEQ